MEDLIEAIKSNDLVKAKKAFGPIMAERAMSVMESRKLEIARSVIIEGEESEEDEDSEDEDEDTKDEDSEEE